MQKYRRYERPGDFDASLTHVWRVLRQVDERVHLVELRGEDSDLIADQLEHCMVGAWMGLWLGGWVMWGRRGRVGLRIGVDVKI